MISKDFAMRIVFCHFVMNIIASRIIYFSYLINRLCYDFKLLCNENSCHIIIKYKCIIFLSSKSVKENYYRLHIRLL